MLAFVEYLVSVKSHSAPIAKLHNLCRPFCALASTALKSADEPSREILESRPFKRPRRNTNDHGMQRSIQPEEPPLQPPTPKQVAQIEQQILPEHNFLSNADDLNNNAAFELNDDMWTHFMDFQPRLQWLDTDFSAFEHTWGTTGLGSGADTAESAEILGNGFI